MSYTLRGRIESRLAAALLPFLAACAIALGLEAWWPVELAGAMIGAGLALDVGLYHRLLPYQPAWAAIPLGLLELTATMALVRLFDIAAPLEPALVVLRRLLGRRAGSRSRGLAARRLTYAEDGGELGRSGVGLVALAPTVVLLVLGTAWATRPPTVHLSAGVHQGPIVITTQPDPRRRAGHDRQGRHRRPGGRRDRPRPGRDRRRVRHRGRSGRRRPPRERVGLGREAGRHPRSPLLADDPQLQDRQPRQNLGAGDRHLLLQRQAPQPGDGLHRRRRARGDRDPFHDGEDRRGTT